MDPRYTKLIAAGLTLGIAALLVFLVASIKPGDKRKLLRIDVADLAPNHVLVRDTGALRYYVVRLTEAQIFVVAVPTTDEGRVPLPDRYWWKPYMKCKEFGLDSEGGIIAGSSRFRCRDGEQPKELAARWQWDLHGRHVPDADNTPIDDLYRIRVERSGDEIILVGLES